MRRAPATEAILSEHHGRGSPCDSSELVQRTRRLSCVHFESYPPAIGSQDRTTRLKDVWLVRSLNPDRKSRRKYTAQGRSDYSMTRLEISPSMQDLHFEIHQPVMI